MADKFYITVVETPSFLARAENLMDEEDPFAIVNMLAEDPECGVLIRGTGGVRKVRVALEGRGKSGGARVVYFFHDLEMPLYILAIFAKNRKASLSPTEKAALKKATTTLVNTHKERRDV